MTEPMTDAELAEVTRFVDVFERWIADGSPARAMRLLLDEVRYHRARMTAVPPAPEDDEP